MNSYITKNEWDVTLDTIQSSIMRVSSPPKSKRVLLGFDGYVDNLYSLVQLRDSPSKWERMVSMIQLADRIKHTVGSSTNVERVLKKQIGGGGAPNTGRALAYLGVEIFLAGALGYPDVLPIFKEFPPSIQERVHFLSVGNPGETIGLEFDDGKVMFTDFGNINNLTWTNILERVGRDGLIDAMELCEGLIQGHWAYVPRMNDIWIHLLNEIFPNLSRQKNRIFFVDPADFLKRSRVDIREMVHLLSSINHHLSVTLSLNDKEGEELPNYIDGVRQVLQPEDLWGEGILLRQVLNIDTLVIHTPHFATITTTSGHQFVSQGFTRAPRFTTAAGDHFNAGLLFGQLQGFLPAESILVGNAVTGHFIRTGVSPSIAETRNFIQKYLQYVLSDRDTII